MKILMLNYEFPPMGGGAGHCTQFLAEKLTQQGFRVDILTSSCAVDCTYPQNSNLRIYQVPIWRKGIHDCGVRGALSYLFMASFKIRSLMRENRYDVIHSFFCLPTSMLFYLLLGFKDIPTIVSLRGSDVPHYDPFNQSLELFHTILRPFSLDIIQKATKVVANSAFLRDLAIRHLERTDMTVIPNGVDIEFFKPNSGDTSSDNPIQLLCVSRMIKRKGIKNLVKAMAKLKNENIYLKIIGSGKSEKEIKGLIESKNLSDIIKLPGFIPQKSLPEHYNNADIFVLPSLTESGGEAFMEAMSCGLPIVSNKAGGIPEYVLNGENGLLVNPGDIDGLHEAIAKLINDRDLRKSMGQKSREIIMTNHSWERITEQYLGVYRELVRQR